MRPQELARSAIGLYAGKTGKKPTSELLRSWAETYRETADELVKLAEKPKRKRRKKAPVEPDTGSPVPSGSTDLAQVDGEGSAERAQELEELIESQKRDLES